MSGLGNTYKKEVIIIFPGQHCPVVLFASLFLLNNNHDHEEIGSLFGDQLGIHCYLKEFAKRYFMHITEKSFFFFLIIEVFFNYLMEK